MTCITIPYKRFPGQYLAILLYFLIFSFPVCSQSLFESALSESNSQQELKYQLNGYFRAGLFASDEIIRGKYSEGALKIDIKGNKYGNAYTELRWFIILVQRLSQNAGLKLYSLRYRG